MFNIKVLLLPSWYPNKDNNLDGVFFKEQAEALSKRGVEVIVLAVKILSLSEIKKTTLKKGLSIEVENGIKVYRYVTYNYFPRLTELYLKYYSRILNKLIPKIEKENGNVDLIHIHSAIDGGIAYSLSKINKPYVITEHSSKYQRNILNEVQKKYLPKLFDNAEKVISVGQGLKNEISKYSKRNDIEVIANLVSLKKYKGTCDKDNSKFRFFSLGVLTKVKGMDILIEAFKEGYEELQDSELYIGGHGLEFEALKNKVKELNLENNIKLIGKLDREEVSKNMAECDAFVLASRYETFGIVFIEAMIHGKPVIATKTGGPDTFVNDDNGLVVEIENIKQLSEAMIKLKREYHKYNSEVIERKCKENFSEDAICKKIINIYNEVISK